MAVSRGALLVVRLDVVVVEYFAGELMKLATISLKFFVTNRAFEFDHPTPEHVRGEWIMLFENAGAIRRSGLAIRLVVDNET